MKFIDVIFPGDRDAKMTSNRTAWTWVDISSHQSIHCWLLKQSAQLWKYYCNRIVALLLCCCWSAMRDRRCLAVFNKIRFQIDDVMLADAVRQG